MFPVFRVKLLRHEQAFFGLDGFDAIDSRCFLALVFLRHSSHCQHSCGFRFHQQLLEFVDCSLITTLTGSVDAFLDAETVLLEFLPGHAVPSLTRLVFRRRRCFPLFHLTDFLPSVQQGPRQPILWLSQRRLLHGPSSHRRHWLAPTRSIDQCCESLPVVFPFRSSVLRYRRCVPVHRAPSWMSRERRTILPLSPVVVGGTVTILVKPVILRRLVTQLRRFLHTFTHVSGWKHCSSS